MNIIVGQVYVHQSSPNGSKCEVLKVTDKSVIVYWNSEEKKENTACIDKDLFLKYYHRPKVTKWINVYKTDVYYSAGWIHDTEATAKTQSQGLGQTIKIELEE